jgi:hypothetical protein
MSTIEILAELPKLSTDELQRIHQRILDLEEQRELEPSPEFNAGIEAGLRSLEDEPAADAAEVRRKIAGWAGRSV